MTTLRRELRRRFNKTLEILFNTAGVSEDVREGLCDSLADDAIDVIQPKNPIQNLPIEWKIAAGMKVEEEDLQGEIIAKEATDDFERSLHFNPLPWDSTRPWEKLKRFVVQEYEKDKTVWQRYDAWRKSDGKYSGAMNNKNISTRPVDFIACFPDFLAHTAMYSKKERVPDEERTDLDDFGAPRSY